MAEESGHRKNPFMAEPARERANISRGGDNALNVSQKDSKEVPPTSKEIVMTDSYMEISEQVDLNPMPKPSISGALDSGSPRRRPESLISDLSFPYDLAGTVSKEGDMTHFIADNLEYQIKLSSPAARKEMSGLYFEHGSTPSSSGMNPSAGRSFFSASQDRDWQYQQARIDPNVLNDIEIEAQYLAASLDNLTENLCNLLHSISSITADNVEIHKNAVNKLTDSMDANIKSMYTIMAKTEEISKSMKPTEQLAGRIREIKKLVDMLESNM